MNSLCNRIRAALNLLLLLSLLQAWVLFAGDKSSVAEDVKGLVADIEQLRKDEVPASVKDFLDSFHFAHSQSAHWDAQPMPLSKIIALTDQDVTDVHLDSGGIAAAAAKVTGSENAAGTMIISGQTPAERYREIKDRFSRTAEGAIADGLARLNRLRDSIHMAGLPINTATVYDLERSFVREVEIPFIKQRIEAHGAFWMLGAAAVAVLALIYIVLDYMWIVLSSRRFNQDETEVFDCVLLYPSRFAVILGTGWLVAPCALLALGLIGRFRVTSGSADWVFIGCLFVLSTGIAIASIRRTWMLRTALSNGRFLSR